jgi:hypothetical protein
MREKDGPSLKRISDYQSGLLVSLIEIPLAEGAMNPSTANARLEAAKELFLGDIAVLQDDAQQSDTNLFRRHGHVDSPVR